MRLDLRPLGIGEILDRAVTLFVRHFAVLVLILALVVIPVAIVQYAAAPSTAGVFSDLQRMLMLPPGHVQEQREILREISQKSRLGTLGAVLILVSLIVQALSMTACVIAVAQSYAGRMPSVREVYREALRRWLPQLAALVIITGFVFVITFALVFAILVLAIAIGAIARLSPVAGAIVGIPIALVVVATLFAAFVLLSCAAQLTLVAIALEDPNPIRGIAAGLRRTFGKALIWRSLLVGTITSTVSLIGTFMLIALAVGLSALTHVSALYPVIVAVGSVALSALLNTFIVVYATDVRVRREGYDLALAAGGSSP
jgi:hypothetical protein